MKRFHFPLDRVRRWRGEQASVEELKLQQLRAEMAGIEEARRQIESERTESEGHVLRQAYVDPRQLASLDSYRKHVGGVVRQLEGRIQQAEAKIAEQLSQVIEARRKFELLDRMRRSAFDQWKAAVNKEQDDLAAELFLAKPRRRS